MIRKVIVLFVFILMVCFSSCSVLDFAESTKQITADTSAARSTGELAFEQIQTTQQFLELWAADEWVQVMLARDRFVMITKKIDLFRAHKFGKSKVENMLTLFDAGVKDYKAVKKLMLSKKGDLPEQLRNTLKIWDEELISLYENVEELRSNPDEVALARVSSSFLKTLGFGLRVTDTISDVR